MVDTFWLRIYINNYMARGDLSVIGISGGARPFRIAASATRGYAGEPVEVVPALSSGVATVNTVGMMTDNKPVIGTDYFVGVAHEDTAVNSSGTVVASVLSVVVPIPESTRIRGKAETPASIDTDAELITFLWDVCLFDLSAAVYTIDESGTANTSALTIVGGIPSKGLLDVTVDVRAMRATVA